MPTNPMTARFLIPLAWVATLHAQAPLTENEAIARALAQPEWQAITRLPADQTAGAVLEAEAWLSPGLEWSREAINGLQPGKREDTYLLTQGLDLSGRWQARREAARRRVEAGAADSALRIAGLVAQVREAFYEVVAARERLSRLDRSVLRLGQAQARVDRLHAAGEMSGLERGRIRREVELLLGRQAQERTGLARAQARLAAILGGGPWAVDGNLLPPPLGSLEGIRARLPGSASMKLTRAQEAAAQADAVAARRWWPELTLGLGVRRWQENGLSGSGSVFSVGLSLPSPGRVQGTRMRAEAEARAATAQARLQRAQDEAEALALWQEARELWSSAERLARETEAPAQVETALEAAFEAGELDLLARLDGSRNLLEAELAALDQAHRARRACIALERLLGKVNP